MKVLLPSVLTGYSAGAREVAASGSTVAEVLADLDRHHPGIRFRMVDELGRLRRHLRLYVNKDPAGLDTAVTATDELLILQRLSGG